MSSVISLICIAISVLSAFAKFELSEAVALLFSAIGFVFGIAGQNKRPKTSNVLIALSVATCIIAVAKAQLKGQTV